MLVRYVWPECKYWSWTLNQPVVDAFWVEASEEELKSQVLPLLSQEQCKEASDLMEELKGYGQIPGVLAARNLTCIKLMKPTYPFGNLWNGYSPFRPIEPVSISRLSEITALACPR